MGSTTSHVDMNRTGSANTENNRRSISNQSLENVTFTANSPTSTERTEVIFVEEGNRLIARKIIRNPSAQRNQVILVEDGNRLIATNIISPSPSFQRQQEQPRDMIMTRIRLENENENRCIIQSFHVLSVEEHDLLILDEKTCSICYEDYSALSIGVMQLPCGHTYHLPCLNEWIKTKRSCPNCRRVLLVI